MFADHPLSLIDIRVLGVLIEKQRTVPDTYPLSVNTLLAGCNQKTSRNPVMEAGEADLLLALESLKAHGFVSEVSGSRVTRFAHAFEKTLGVPLFQEQAMKLAIVAAGFVVDGGITTGQPHSWNPEAPGIFDALQAYVDTPQG